MNRIPYACAAIALLASAAQAQTTLPPVTVTADIETEGSLTVPSVREQERAVRQTAGSVGFVDAETYKDGYASTVRDALQDAPGIFVQNRYGQEMRLSVRGSGIARSYHTRGIETLLDGIPTNQADGSGDLYQIDPMALRSIEIYKGGNGLAYGATTLGGAINFVTPTAYTATAPNIVGLSGSSHGTVQGNAQVSRVIGNYDFLANVTGWHSDGFRDHADGDYAQINTNLGYRFNTGAETRFYLGSFNIDQSLPGAITLDQVRSDPKQATASALNLDTGRIVNNHRIANRTSVLLDVGQLDVASWLVRNDLYHPIAFGASVFAPGIVVDQESWTWGIAPRYTASFDLGGDRNDLILGARLWAGRVAARNYANAGGSRGALQSDADQESANYQLYAENRWFFLPTVALVAGAKLFHSERDYTNNLNGMTASRDYDGINPKLGLLWEPRKDIQVFADVTRSQDVPDFTDLAQTNLAGTTFVPLDAQEAWTYEIGTRGKAGRFEWDVTAYHARVDGEMLQYTPGGSFLASTFNADRTVHQGIELGGTLRAIDNVFSSGDGIALTQIWNWNDFRFDGDARYGDTRLPGIPEHMLRTMVRYSHSSGFYLQPAVDWVPDGAFADYANTKRVPGYALLGLSTGMQMQDGMTLFLEGRNLTDKRYVSDIGPVVTYATTDSVFYPGEGRTVYGGVRMQF